MEEMQREQRNLRYRLEDQENLEGVREGRDRYISHCLLLFGSERQDKVIGMEKKQDGRIKASYI